MGKDRLVGLKELGGGGRGEKYEKTLGGRLKERICGWQGSCAPARGKGFKGEREDNE